jgi:hypothetical protein
MNNPIIVKTYLNRIEAEIGRGKLESNRIEAIVQADDEGGMAGHLLFVTGFVKLLVSKNEFAKAKKILGVK